MALFREDAKLKALVTWAKQQTNALAFREHLAAAAPDTFDIKAILDSRDEQVFDAASKAAIDTADCVIMLAADEDWALADSAIREREYFKHLVREGRKSGNQFRFVETAGRRCPAYETAGCRVLRVRDPANPSPAEIAAALAVLSSQQSDAAPQFAVTAGLLAEPQGLLAATLWLISFDETVLPEGKGEIELPPNALTAGLKYLKSLHSIHSGLGAMVAGPMTTIASLPPSTPVNIERERNRLAAQLGGFRPPHAHMLQDAMADCIGQGLLPFLRSLSRRFGSMPTTPVERTLLMAMIERLEAVITDKDELEPGGKDRDAMWWVTGYLTCLDRIQTSFARIASDDNLAPLKDAKAGGAAFRDFDSVYRAAANLHVANLQLAFLVTVLFSFLHIHRSAAVEGLTPGSVEDAIEQILTEWNRGPATEAVVKWSNQLILRHLAAVEQVEEHSRAAA